MEYTVPLIAFIILVLAYIVLLIAFIKVRKPRGGLIDKTLEQLLYDVIGKKEVDITELAEALHQAGDWLTETDNKYYVRGNCLKELANKHLRK